MKDLVTPSIRAALLSAIILALSGCATNQNLPKETVNTVQKTVEMPGMSKPEICKKSRDWVANTFRDSKAVIEVYDLEEGTIIGKGAADIIVMSGFVPVDFSVRFTMRIDCRDGRYRFTATNPSYTASQRTIEVAANYLVAPEYLKFIDRLNASLLASVQSKSNF